MASSTSNGAPVGATAQPRRGIKQILQSYFYWTYSRGSFHYDIMVTLILLFIFVTPHLWDYGAKPPLCRRPRASYPGGRQRPRRHRHRAGFRCNHSCRRLRPAK